MKKLIRIIFIITISVTFSYAQVSILSGNNGYLTQSSNTNKNVITKIEILPSKDTATIYKYMNDQHEEIVLGTPFYKNGSFDKETVYIDGSEIKGGVLYDLISEKIQFSTDSFLTSNIIKPDSFTVGSLKLTKIDHLFYNAHKRYYEEIYNDDYNQIFKRYTCEIKSIQKNKTGYDITTDKIVGKFVKSSEYYFVRNNRLELIKKNTNICKQLGLFQKDLEWFAEAKNLKFDNDKDIIELMKYYNTLFNN